MSEEKLEGYPLVAITNSTSHQAKGHVTYPGCHGDDWTALPWDTWKASSRGLCLVSKITAEVNVGGNWVGAEPYTSSGTSCTATTPWSRSAPRSSHMRLSLVHMEY